MVGPLAGCAASPTAPLVYAPLTFTDLVVGTGDEVLRGTALTVNYTGWLYDPAKADHKGAIFDTTVGGTSYSFEVGFGDVIDGWDEGIPGMRVGGIRRLIIPPSKGYGDTRRGQIPPNATLLFEVEVVSIP